MVDNGVIYMDDYLYRELNKILKNFLSSNNSKIFMNLLDSYSVIFDSIYNNDLFAIETDKYSRKFTLNETVNIIDEFLGSFDKDLQSRFNAIIRMTLDDGTPIVNFIKLEDGMVSDNRLDKDNKVYVYYNESLDDCVSLIHEVFHKINILQMEIEGERSNTLSNMMFSENVSFIAELALLDYMKNKSYITENDFCLKMNKRISNSSLAAGLLIVEKELLDLVDKGLEIDRCTLEALRSFYKNDDIRGPIWQKECDDENTLLNIIDQGAIFSVSTLPYVIGQFYLEKVMNKKDKSRILSEVNALISNPNISLPYIVNDYYEKELSRRK